MTAPPLDYVGGCPLVSRSGAGPCAALLDDVADQSAEFVVGNSGRTLRGRETYHREDAASQVRTARRRIVVGCVVESFDGHPDGAHPVQPRCPQFLQGALSELRPRTDRLVVLLGISAAGNVEAEDPPGRWAPAVVSGVHDEYGEHRHDQPTLHSLAEVATDHGGEPVRLPVQRELGPLYFLEVLELDLEQPDDLDGHSGCARDTDQRVVVGSEALLDIALRDEIARGRSPIAGHHNPALVRG